MPQVSQEASFYHMPGETKDKEMNKTPPLAAGPQCFAERWWPAEALYFEEDLYLRSPSAFHRFRKWQPETGIAKALDTQLTILFAELEQNMSIR